MSAAELDVMLTDALAPPDAPSDDEIRAWAESHEYVDPEGNAATPVQLPFSVDSIGSADWAGRKIQQAKRRVAEVRAWRDRIVAEADAAVAREQARQQPTVEFFEAHLAAWLRREIEADTSKRPRKSRDLPCGVRVRQTPGGKSLAVDDADALVDWLQTYRPDLVGEPQVVYPWSKTDVKKIADDDGRIVVVDPESGEIVEAPARVETSPSRVIVDVGGDA